MQSDNSIPRSALLLSGHTRSLQTNLADLLELKAALNCDIFVHTWTSPDMAEPTWRMPEEYTLAGETIADLVRALEPRAIEFEESNESTVRQWHCAEIADRLTGAHYMTYGIFRSHEIFTSHCRRTGEQYQNIIRYRFDLACLEKRALALALSAIASNSLAASRHNWGESLGCVFDGVFAARVDDFSRLAIAIRDRFHSAFKELASTDRFIAELIVTNIAREVGLVIQLVPARFSIVRKDGVYEQTFGGERGGIVQRARSLCTAYVVCSKVDRAERSNSTICRAWRATNPWPVRWAVELLYPPYLAVKTAMVRSSAAKVPHK